MAVKRDFYEVLSISKEATTEEVEKAYRKLARQYHPDRNIGDPEAEVKFKEVQEARDILCDEQKRAVYDRYGHAGLDRGTGGFGPGGAGDVFTDLINNFFGGGGRRQSGPQPGRDIQVVVDITLLEAFTGIKQSLTIPRLEVCTDCSGKGTKTGNRSKCNRCDGRGVEISGRPGDFFATQRTCSKCGGRGQIISDPCKTCRGAGRVEAQRTIEVTVPAGVDTGMRMQIRGEGEAGEPGAPRGDLEVVFRVAAHSDFEREGNNLICAVPVTYSQAALGTSMEVPTLTGKTSLTVPPGTQTHTEMRMRGQGMPNVRGGRPGDLRVVVIVETPTQLTKRQEELLRELAEIEHKEVSPNRKSFLNRLKGLFGPDADAKK